MQVTVFGANGKVGWLIVQQLLDQNHDVVAFVHSTSKLAEASRLKLAQGDVHDGKAVAEALRGSGAVICALGSWGTKGKDILSAGMRQIIPAMEEQGVRRIITVTGADARAAGDVLSPMHRLSHSLLKIIGGKVLSDGEQHIALLEASDLGWTVVRSPVMNEHGDAELYELSDKRPLPWTSVNRHAVAKSMVDLLQSGEHSRHAPYIVRA